MSFQFLGLQRPQYPSSPEVLLSTLAWSVVPRKLSTAKTGLIYERLPPSSKKKRKRIVEIEQTRPTGQSLDAFCSSLEHNGFGDKTGKVAPELGRAVANALLGVKPDKGVGIASSAVGVAGALLQDAVGGLAVSSPPNFAHLINTLFSLGAPEGNLESASGLWFAAASKFARSPALEKIEVALFQSALSPYVDTQGAWPPREPRLLHGATPEVLPNWWINNVARANVPTPFRWFFESWTRLCSDAWVRQLGPRRWASWAVCVLRQALGFCFLWEANFYQEIARAILSGDGSAEEGARRALWPVRPLIPVLQGTISQMDVAPGMKRSLTIGLGCRKSLELLVKTHNVSGESLEDFIGAARVAVTGAERAQLQNDLGGYGDQGGLTNLLETVRYSLLIRSNEDSADNYGLLRTVSRNFSHVAPGAEWIVVISAMASLGPAEIVRLGDVLESLRALGMQPRIDFIVSELERAGLCASAADGDEGIEINLGFGGS